MKPQTVLRLLMPTFILFMLAAISELSDFDMALSGTFFRLEGGEWALKHNWWFETLFHDQARKVMVALLACVLLFWLTTFLPANVRPAALTKMRRGSGYLLLSAIISSALVSLIKRYSNVDCPWDLAIFGGDMPYIPLYEPRPDDLPRGICFPAGHASAAYAWFGIFFLALRYRPQWQGYALASVLAIGILFGGVQELRGAHFLSHDLTTAGLCYGVAALLYALMLRPKRVKHPDWEAE